MSEMNISRDPLSAPKTDPNIQTKDSTAPPASYQLDSLEAFSTSSLLSVQRTSDAPQLAQPEVYPDSMIAYFKAISGASLAFKQQLSASDSMDLDVRRLSSLSAAKQALLLQNLLDKRDQAIKDLEANAKKALEELQKKIEEMQTDTKQQQKRIDQINQGNAEEKRQYKELAKAYDNYLSRLKDIGVKDQGNGIYVIPEGAEDDYNEITEDYQKAVGKFNTYWKGRKTELNAYNTATSAYNQKVVEYNQAIADLMDKYPLGDYSELPYQDLANRRDLAGAPDQIKTPSPIHKTPASISVNPLNAFTQRIAASGPPVLSSLNEIPSWNEEALYKGIYDSLYAQNVAALDQEISKIVLYWQFYQNQNNSLTDSASDPLLNSKPLAQRILPDTTKTTPKRAILSGTPGGIIPLQSVGVDSSQLAAMLGQAVLKQAIEELLLKLSKEKGIKVAVDRVDKVADKLVLYSIGLMGNQSLQALFPSVSPISKSLSSLPPDSPVFALLFAISFANRIQEDANQGINKEALQTFLQAIPELKGLSEEDQGKLEATITLGQLMIAMKMIETSLGLPGLTNELLIPLTSLNPELLLRESAEERKPVLKNLQQAIEAKFIQQGYPKEEAEFLGRVGIQLSEQGLLTPAAASIPSPEAIHRPLLVDSVKAALVLAKIPLKEAESLAEEAVESALTETPYSTTQQLRSAIETHLQDMGIKDKASDIARQAVILPPAEDSLVLVLPRTSTLQSAISGKEQPAITTAAGESLPPTPITAQTSMPRTPSDLFAMLEKRALQLLTPHLGMQVAKEVTVEMAKTLFGISEPKEQTMAEMKSPYSMLNVIQNQLYHLRVDRNQKMAEAVTQTFKETIKSMESFYAFSLKLMDPAYLLVYSGIIYGDHGRKNKLDIPI